MCIATKLVNELTGTIKKIDEEWERLSKLQGQLDREINERYHLIEKNNFNAAEGYYHARKLQIALRKRRVVKNEIATFSKLRKQLDLTSVNETIPVVKNTLDNLHKHFKKDDWKLGWKETYRAEDMELNH